MFVGKSEIGKRKSKTFLSRICRQSEHASIRTITDRNQRNRGRVCPPASNLSKRQNSRVSKSKRAKKRKRIAVVIAESDVRRIVRKRVRKLRQIARWTFARRQPLSSLSSSTAINDLLLLKERSLRAPAASLNKIKN